jgi:hypothetical protein
LRLRQFDSFSGQFNDGLHQGFHLRPAIFGQRRRKHTSLEVSFVVVETHDDNAFGAHHENFHQVLVGTRHLADNSFRADSVQRFLRRILFGGVPLRNQNDFLFLRSQRRLDCGKRRAAAH